MGKNYYIPIQVYYCFVLIRNLLVSTNVLTHVFFTNNVTSRHKPSALTAGLLVGNQKGDIFDYMTHLLENFENEDEKSRERILSTGSDISTEDTFIKVIKVKF